MYYQIIPDKNSLNIDIMIFIQVNMLSATFKPSFFFIFRFTDFFHNKLRSEDKIK